MIDSRKSTGDNRVPFYQFPPPGLFAILLFYFFYVLTMRAPIFICMRFSSFSYIYTLNVCRYFELNEQAKKKLLKPISYSQY